MVTKPKELTIPLRKGSKIRATKSYTKYMVRCVIDTMREMQMKSYWTIEVGHNTFVWGRESEKILLWYLRY